MRAFWALFRRELLAFFVTPLAWIVVALFLFVQGLHFQLVIEHFAERQLVSDDTPLQAFFGNTVFFYVVLFLFVPALTMRAFAEERSRGTLESLLSAPIGTSALVLAKYAALVVGYVTMWLPTVLYVVVLARTGPVDGGAVAAAYGGALLVGAMYLAVGVLWSSVTSSQLVALIGTGITIVALFIVGLLGESYAADGTLLHDVAVHVSVWVAMNDFAAGVIDSRHLVFALTTTALALFLSVRVIDGLRGGARSERALPLAGVAAAVAFLVVANGYALRRVRRVDVSASAQHTLSPATKATLATLGGAPEPVEIFVVLGRAEPLTEPLRKMLASYRAEAPSLRVRFVDPDLDGAGYAELRRRFGLAGDASGAAQLHDDVAVIVARGARRHLVDRAELVAVESAEKARVRPREERALTAALRAVLSDKTTRLCVTAGHGERSVDDTRGLQPLAEVLRRDRYQVATVDVTLPNATEPYRECTAVVVASPERTFSPSEAARLRTYLMEGGSAFVVLGPAPTRTGLAPHGLDEALRPFGIATRDGLVIETDETRALPSARGTAFLADVRSHPLTAPLVSDRVGTLAPPVMLELARPLAVHAEAGAAAPVPLLATSDAAFAVVGVREDTEWAQVPTRTPADLGGPLTLALASERPKLAPSAARGPRVVVVGSTSVVAPRRDPLAFGTILFAEAALAWLTDNMLVLDVPDRPPVTAGVRLTAASLGEVKRYVVFAIPLGFAALGVVVVVSRRRPLPKVAS